MTGVKSLLGVRVTTPNLTCLLEAGKPSLKALVREKQARFFNKIQQRNGMLVTPCGMFGAAKILGSMNQGIFVCVLAILI